MFKVYSRVGALLVCCVGLLACESPPANSTTPPSDTVSSDAAAVDSQTSDALGGDTVAGDTVAVDAAVDAAVSDAVADAGTKPANLSANCSAVYDFACTGACKDKVIGLENQCNWAKNNQCDLCAAALASFKALTACGFSNVPDAVSCTQPQPSDAGSTDTAGQDVPPPPTKTGSEIVASFDDKACGAGGCSSAALTDFTIDWKQCTISKSGNQVTVARKGGKIAPIVGYLDSIQDKVGISGNSLVMSLGEIGDDITNVSITFNKTTGAVTSATATRYPNATAADQVTRIINCDVETSGNFPSGTASKINTIKELVDAFQYKNCSINNDGAGFLGCTAAALPDFSLPIHGCTLTKSGETMTITKGTEVRTVKWNGGKSPLDGDGANETPGGGGMYIVKFGVAEIDTAASSSTLFQMMIRTDDYSVMSMLTTVMQTGQQMKQLSCQP